MHSPVEQFTIKVLYDLHLFGYDISFTNSALFMILAVLVSTIFLVMAMRPAAIVPGRMQAAAEMMYEFVADMVRSNICDGFLYFHCCHAHRSGEAWHAFLLILCTGGGAKATLSADYSD